MVQRRYGPVLGAGVAVIEQEAAKSITPGRFGLTSYVGVLERGDIGKLIYCPNKRAFERKCGGLLEDFQLPLVCRHFFEHDNGAGALYLYRITDGTEVEAIRTIEGRRKLWPEPDILKVEAKNGGSWAGQAQWKYGVMTTPATELTETTLDTGVAMKVNEWKGGTLKLNAVAKVYTIVSNDDAGVVTVTPDSTMKTDFGSSTDNGYLLELKNNGRAVSILIKDGLQNPETEFGMEVYLNGELVLEYENLSLDPLSEYFVEPLVNDDGNNEYIKVTLLWTGATLPEYRPANIFAQVETTPTSNVLETKIWDFAVTNSPGGANPTVDTVTYQGTVRRDKLTLTVTDDVAGTFSITSEEFGDLGSGTIGTPVPADNVYTIGFTLTDGITPLADNDVVEIYIRPLEVSAMKGFTLIPDVDERRAVLRIKDNDHDTITVATGVNLGDYTEADKWFRVNYPQALAGGYDGLEGLSDADYIQAFEVGSGLDALGELRAFVKVATPGENAAAVQKAGIAFADRHNFQFRYEIPSTIVDEADAEEYINDTIGRNDFAVGAFPSYGKITNPAGAGRITVPLTGMIHGREALVARNYNGYHKAAAGIDVTLPFVLELPTGEKVLDEELLNPQGIQVIKFYAGNAIIWGDRTLALDPAWKWKHQREMMSYYETDLMNNFGWIIFAINNPRMMGLANAALRDYFRAEWKKEALQGATFEEACEIKIDTEINTPGTRAAGDMFAEVTLWLADTVERFAITISKQGIFESVG